MEITMNTLKKKILEKIIYFTLLLMTVTEEKALEDVNQPGNIPYSPTKLIERGIGIEHDIKAFDIIKALGTKDVQAFIFSFLDTKDFLRASHASLEWRKVAYVAGYTYDNSIALALSNRYMDETSCQALCHAPFSVLILKNCYLEGEGVIFLSRQASLVKKLDLSYSRIGGDGAKALASGNLAHLNSLNLSEIPIKDEGAQALASGNLTGLTYLDLSGTLIKDAGVKALASGNLVNLNSLNLSYSRIRDEALKALASGNLVNLNCLNLSYSRIRDEGAKALASGNLVNLNSLNLSYSHIRDEGAKALASGTLTALTSLNLSANPIGDEGVKALAIGTLTALISLNLSYSHIGDEGAKALALGRLTNLNFLDLSGTRVGLVGAQELARANFRRNGSRSTFLLTFSRIQKVEKPFGFRVENPYRD
jgi:Leucine-rich repeat (LRR) protein